MHPASVGCSNDRKVKMVFCRILSKLTKKFCIFREETFVFMYEILTVCPLFRGLPAEKIKELLENRQYSVDTYTDGEYIARRDVAYSGLMIVLKGSVRGERPDSSGKKMKIDNITAPQLIAPAFLFGGYNRLPIDVVADGDVSIMTLHRGLLFELMQDNTIILSNFIDIISNRANMLSRKIYFLSFRNLKDKIVKYIEEHLTDTGDSFEIAEMNELSEYFDAPRYSITAVLEDMEKDGIISLKNNTLTVKDRSKLK